MDSLKSFKGYGRADDAENQEFRKKTRKRICIIAVSSIVLIAVIIGVVAGTLLHKRNSGTDSESLPNPSTPSAMIRAVCKTTLHPDSCFSSISSLSPNSTNLDPETIFKLSLRLAINETSKLPDKLAAKIKTATASNPRLAAAFNVCKTVFDDAVDSLSDSISSMEVGEGKKMLSPSKIDGIRTWLGAALTDHETCLDALRELNSTAKLVDEFSAAMKSADEFTSNSLAIVAKILGLLSDFDIPVHRRLLSVDMNDGFPSWVGKEERRVLLAEGMPRPHMTVALDGTGTHQTIQAAVDSVPKKQAERTVIYVKAGTYKENVNIDKNKWNIMMYGDGVGATVVSAGLNFIDGTATFHTATFAVAGKGFIAKHMTFVNTAGAAKHQAVAFRSGSDESVYYRCSFDGFQDTLYVHSNRQFYRECDVTGTIDFIFGNAAVVLQNCNIRPRQPLPRQFNTVTAQGKKDPNMKTGIVIDGCTFSPLEKNMTADTYLGRPWKDYSTTVIMRSEIGAFVHVSGWIGWVFGVDPPDTILYGEYKNTGAGAGVEKRVKWRGYKASMTAEEAAEFTVNSLLRGEEWLPATDVPADTTV